MAYLFRRLNDAIDEAGGRRGSDVLGQQAAGGQPAQADRETPQGMIGSQPSAVIGGQNAQKPVAPGEDATAVNSDARNKVFGKNQSTQLTAGAADDIASGIKASQDTLQGEANKYLNNGFEGFNRGAIDKAIDANDEGARSSVSGFLNTKSERPADFSFTDKSIDALRDETRALQSDGGLQSALQTAAAQRKGDEGYTAGEARLDSAFLKNSDAFKKQKQAAINSFASLSDAQGATRKQAESRQANYVQDRDAEQAAVRQLLGDRAAAIRKAAEGELATKNAALVGARGSSRAAETSGVRGDAQQQLDELTALEKRLQISGQGSGWVPEYDKASVESQRAALKEMINNPNKFVSQGSNAYGLEDVVTADQQGDYEWLNTLLGSGDRLSRREGATFDAAATRKDKAFNFDALRALLAEKDEKDKAWNAPTPASKDNGYDTPDPLLLPDFFGKKTLAGKAVAASNAPTETTVDAVRRLGENLGLRGTGNGIDPAVAAEQRAREEAEADKNYSYGAVVGSKTKGDTLLAGGVPLPSNFGAGLQLGGNAPAPASQAQRMASPQYQGLVKEMNRLMDVAISTRPGPQQDAAWKQYQQAQAASAAYLKGGA